jgi:hypothetical protein
MDKDTILFVRKNQYALAFQWDFFKNATSLVSKYFTKDPPVAVYYKAGEDLDSWVDYKLAVDDGKWIGLLDPVKACEDAYKKGNRLVKDLNVVIPNTIYVDNDGYEYHIPINDGEVQPVYRTKIAAGNPDKSEVGISQFSVYNESLPFESRHMMDDIKLTFKENGLRENNITTFNMLMVPTLFDDNDPKLSYIRNALRMANYQSLETVSEEFALPLTPIIPSESKYVPHGNLDVPNGKYNRFFGSSWGTLYSVSSDNILRQTRDFINLAWETISVPPLVSASRDGSVSLTDEQLEGLYPKQMLMVVPGPLPEMLFAYDAESSLNGAPSSYNQYAVSFDNGLHWNKNFYDAIASLGQITDPLYFFYIPYPKAPNKLLVAIANGAGTTECYETENGTSWVKISLPEDIPLGIDIDNSREYHNSLFKNNIFTPNVGDRNLYIDKDNRIQIKTGETSWKVFATTDEIESKINDMVFQSHIGDATFDAVHREINIVYRYDIENEHLQIGYHFLGFGLIPKQNQNDPDPSYDRRTTIGAYQESGTFYMKENNVPGSDPVTITFNERYTNKTIQDIQNETGQFDRDSLHGEFVVSFDPNDVYFIDGKWIIRDTLTKLNAGPITGDMIDNLDKRQGFVFRISEDFFHWFPVRGISGEQLPDSPAAHIYVDTTTTKGIVFIVQDDKAFAYTVPRKGVWHYTLRTNIHKWEGVKLSQQIKANYIVDGTKEHVSETDEPPVVVGFGYNLNPNATILLYNGFPILDGSAYVNPENNREIIVSNMVEKHMLQQTLMPIQYKKGKRKYVAEDFAVIIARAEDVTKDVYAFIAPGKAYSFGKEVFVDFNTNLSGDLILFNGIDHEYEIIGKRNIKYTFSRFGISEVLYDFLEYNTVGYTNYLSRGNEVYRLQFLLTPKT